MADRRVKTNNQQVVVMRGADRTPPSSPPSLRGCGTHSASSPPTKRSNSWFEGGGEGEEPESSWFEGNAVPLVSNDARTIKPATD